MSTGVLCVGLRGQFSVRHTHTPLRSDSVHLRPSLSPFPHPSTLV
jgi:hypothetical protein